MLILLSPSKTMTRTPSLSAPLQGALAQGQLRLTSAEGCDTSALIIEALLRELGRDEERALEPLKALMGVSEKLARSTHQALMSWEPLGAQPALLSYTGAVFQGLAPEQWSAAQWARASERLMVLSGLYGALRPLDQLCLYRLEMGLTVSGSLCGSIARALSALGRPSRATLAQLWRAPLTQRLKESAVVRSSEWLLNLSSLEYSQALDLEALGLKVCAPRFLDLSPKGDYKVISRHAKRARGLMARYALSVGASHPHELSGFDLEGYELAEAESRLEAGELVFKRARQP